MTEAFSLDGNYLENFTGGRGFRLFTVGLWPYQIPPLKSIDRINLTLFSVIVFSFALLFLESFITFHSILVSCLTYFLLLLLYFSSLVVVLFYYKLLFYFDFKFYQVTIHFTFHTHYTFVSYTFMSFHTHILSGFLFVMPHML